MTLHVPAALGRARGTIRACELIHELAPQIAHVCSETGPRNLVVTVVESGGGTLSGIWTIPREDLARRVPELESGGWTFTFAGGTSAAHIQAQALRTARLAFARWIALQRWSGRQW
jgi:hypothetical protein